MLTHMASGTPGRLRVLLLAATVLVAAGCVTLTPRQHERLAEVQAFADSTAARYKVSRVSLLVEPATSLGVGARYRLGHVYLNVRMLDSRGLTAIMAHELAHYLLGHDTLAAGASMGELQRAQELRELEANAKAVEILMRVQGMTEREAVGTVIGHLRGAQVFQERGGAVAWGHRLASEEIGDLLERFPASRSVLR